MTFRRRAYPEVLENLLTALSGGIAAEAHAFPPDGATKPPFRLALEQAQVRDIVSVHGTRNGKSHRFRKGTDYALEGGSLVWPEGAELPDAGTVVQVNYFGPPRPGPVTDIHTGSVARTLAETIGLEIAGLYAQLEAVYNAAFLDTAEGRSLDHVVALLGIERVRGGRAETQLEFTRAPGSRGAITVPAGTRVMDAAGEIEYATTEDATLAPEQRVVRVNARDLEPNDPVAADTLTVMPVPISGIVKVTNPGPAVLGTRDETDAELRTRAKSFLHGSERATLGALRQAVSRQGGGIAVEVTEDAVSPGFVTVTAHAGTLPPTLNQRVLSAIQDVRPAGVRVSLAGQQPPQSVDLALRLVTGSSLLEQDLRAAHDAVRAGIGDYFDTLPVREAGSVNRLVGIALGVPGVEDVRLVSASVNGTEVLDRDAGILAIADMPTVLGKLNIADANLATVVLAAITFPEGEPPPDVAQATASIEAAIAYVNGLNASEPLPSGTAEGDADRARRSLSFGKLLLVTPLPNHAASSLETHDDAVAAGTATALPDGSAVLPYRVSFIFTQATDLAQRLTQASDSYALTPFERLTLGAVEIAEDDGA